MSSAAPSRLHGMPEPSTANGAPCWADLITGDTDGARRFYAGVFGWSADDPNPEFGGYANFVRDGSWIAGLMGNAHDPSAPVTWGLHLHVDDVEDALGRAKDHGAEVVAPAMAVGELGTMALITDPGGAFVGLWQPGTHRGFAVVGEPGAPGWFELHTTAHAESVAFYRDVFGLGTLVAGDTDAFRYVQLLDPSRSGDEAGIAGIMDSTAYAADVPNHWAIYFSVEDADATVEQVVAGGGEVVDAPEDTPYGRLAVVRDPAGATFRLVAG